MTNPSNNIKNTELKEFFIEDNLSDDDLIETNKKKNN
ncbi:unnamed protein product [uncultured virus]|nr:unnamed protein product [uncultured virus]